MKKSKIFIGPANIANIGQSLKIALEEVKISSAFYSWRTEENCFSFSQNKKLFLFNSIPKIFNKNITHIINYFLKATHLFTLILRYNTFIFISPHTLLPNNSDLKILKLFRKKVITFFVGCTERKTDLYPDNKEYICNRCLDTKKQKFCLCNDIQRKALRVQFFEKYSDFIVSQEDSSGYLLNKKPIWFHVISDYPHKKNYLKKYQEGDLTIVHFPSNPIIKLSRIIIPVLEKISKEKSNVRIIIKDRIPHDQVLFHLEKAHILIDALGLSYGVLAVEAMARGCIVVCGEMEFINNQLQDHPLIQATSNNLYGVVNKLIDNKANLQNLAIRSMDFYNQFHSPRMAGEYYKKKLNL